MKIAIIGFGNMGQTYANSFMSSGFVGASDILILNKIAVAEKILTELNWLTFIPNQILRSSNQIF